MLFWCRKLFEKVFSIGYQITPPLASVSAKRGRSLFALATIRWKGGEIMKPSDFQKTIQCQFECKLKKVVKGIIWNYRKELKRRKNKEISFSELPDITVESLATWDDYETNYTIFNVCGIDIKVLDDELAEALKQLPEKKRNNVLMYYFLEMSDTEIADIMNYTRGAVFKHRHRALETMKEILKEKK